MSHLPPSSLQSCEESCRWGVRETLCHSCALPLCISESCPLSGQPGGDQEAKRKRHRAPLMLKCMIFAILRKTKLNTSNLQRSRPGKLTFHRVYCEENDPVKKRQGPSASWTLRILGDEVTGLALPVWSSPLGFCLKG